MYDKAGFETGRRQAREAHNLCIEYCLKPLHTFILHMARNKRFAILHIPSIKEIMLVILMK